LITFLSLQTFFSSAEQLCRGDLLTDVTLTCGQRHFAAHKLVLSVCSGYFAQLFANKKMTGNGNNNGNAIVYLKDVNPRHVELILSYMYRGEINVHEEDLMALLDTAKGLQVKGLTEAGEAAGASTAPTTSGQNHKRKMMMASGNHAARESQQEKRARTQPTLMANPSSSSSSSVMNAGPPEVSGLLPTVDYDEEDYGQYDDSYAQVGKFFTSLSRP